MDKEKLNSFLKTNAELEPAQVGDLSSVLEKHPYFQAVRALQLKGFYQSHSLAYNGALKKTAAYTTDRSVLFDYITSDDFLQDHISGQISRRHRAMEKEKERKTDLAEAIKMKRSEADQVLDPHLFEEIEGGKEDVVAGQTAPAKEILTEEESEKDDRETEKTNVSATAGTKDEPKAKPVKFDKTQEHSFSDWLKLMKAEPIKRAEDEGVKKKKTSREHQIIDRFIEKSPRIRPSDKGISQVSLKDYEPDTRLMTETLAKVYADQKNYDKAIQAYKILKLKNPEKSGLFADRIREIEKIKENKNK